MVTFVVHSRPQLSGERAQFSFVGGSIRYIAASAAFSCEHGELARWRDSFLLRNLYRWVLDVVQGLTYNSLISWPCNGKQKHETSTPCRRGVLLNRGYDESSTLRHSTSWVRTVVIVAQDVSTRTFDVCDSKERNVRTLPFWTKRVRLFTQVSLSLTHHVIDS